MTARTFATSFGHQQFAFNVAKNHPDVVFEHAGGWMQAANFGNFFGATQAAWYPMGVAAGKMTKSNTLGFVPPIDLTRQLKNTKIVTYGRDFATANTEFKRVGSSMIGRQSHVWLRTGEGCRIAAAHVSLMPASSRDAARDTVAAAT